MEIKRSVSVSQINLTNNFWFSLKGVFYLQTNEVKTFSKGLIGAAKSILSLQSGIDTSRVRKILESFKSYASNHWKDFFVIAVFKALMEVISFGQSSAFDNSPYNH